MNSQHEPINYRIVQSHIEDSLGKKVSEEKFRN
jgi:hypothetical protein